MISLEDFWRINDQINANWGKKAYKHIDYCGIIPIRPLQPYGYFCTPSNSLTFATTAGNGVHFGIVKGQNEKGNPGPIVMTVPMATINNVVVAEDLEEFFSIGFYKGWFALEQLVYDEADTLAYYAAPEEDPESSKEERLFLELIRQELAIKHIPLSKERLAYLHQLYFDKLAIEPFGESEEIAKVMDQFEAKMWSLNSKPKR